MKLETLLNIGSMLVGSLMKFLGGMPHVLQIIGALNQVDAKSRLAVQEMFVWETLPRLAGCEFFRAILDLLKTQTSGSIAFVDSWCQCSLGFQSVFS